MATKKQVKANKKNALESTGPRTPSGKAIVATNAVKHGLTGVAPVIVGLEREEDWRDFCDGVLADLAPQGSLEEALAERVALSYWRLQRVARYETGVINVSQEEIGGTFKELDAKLKEATENRDLAQSRVESSKPTLAFLMSLTTLADDEKVEAACAHKVIEAARMAMDGLPARADFAKVMGLPPEAHENIWAWDGWTAGLLRKVMATLASWLKTTPEDVLARCLNDQTEIKQMQAEWSDESQTLIDNLTCRRREIESRLRRHRMLPDEKTLARIARYEGHLAKQFSQALHEFQRIQELRRGGYVPPPTMVDVNINGIVNASE